MIETVTLLKNDTTLGDFIYPGLPAEGEALFEVRAALRQRRPEAVLSLRKSGVSGLAGSLQRHL
jgi:hypothetical protein